MMAGSAASAAPRTLDPLVALSVFGTSESRAAVCAAGAQAAPAAGAGQLCLTTGAAQECWPYAQPFQAGQPLSLTSGCNSASRWTALSTNMAPPAQMGAGERGR